MGFATPVDLGTAIPACITLATGGTVLKSRLKKEAVFARPAMTEAGLHGQSKVKRIKYTRTANGHGVATAAAGTGVGTSEATAIIDKLVDGRKNEDYKGWSVEAHWYGAPSA